jgi:glucose-1-phosphate adenylyltransferase
MDYTKLLQHHKDKGADATISVKPVSWEEAPRFGILNTTEDLQIYEFDEKPENPKSNLASMGIYIFNWSSLKAYLLDDAANEQSSHDFGNDIIPAMVDDGLKLYAYRFEDYWKDVGTIESYWEANMDLLDEDLHFLLNDKNWRTYSNESNIPPQYIGETAVVKQSLINSGCWISGTVENSIVFENVAIEKNSIVSQSILHPGVKVGRDVVLERVIVMGDTDIPDGTRIQVQADEEPLVIDQESLTNLLVTAKV